MIRFGHKRWDREAIARARDSQAQALTEAGVPVREDLDQRKEWAITCTYPGHEFDWRAVPRRGYKTYRVICRATGSQVMAGTPKTIMAAARAKMPEVRRAPKQELQQYSARDEADAARAHKETA